MLLGGNATAIIATLSGRCVGIAVCDSHYRRLSAAFQDVSGQYPDAKAGTLSAKHRSQYWLLFTRLLQNLWVTVACPIATDLFRAYQADIVGFLNSSLSISQT